MFIKNLTIKKFRAFQEPTTVKLGRYVTCISGVNGVGKSTILAILSNIGELRHEKTVTGEPFRGEFANVVLYDGKHDSIGSDKVKIEFEDSIFEGDTLYFRALTQDPTGKKRYRLIPQKKPKRMTEAKLPWPAYYLTLSRLIPVGESDSAKQKELPADIERQLLDKHRFIMKEAFDPESTDVSASNVEIPGQKQGNFGIDTPDYSATSNSSGQDNLGQILRAVWSFRLLKERMGEDFAGGILCIDELDAALHPGAQNLLFDFLLEDAEKVGYQIVFTTHSLSLLTHITEKVQLPANRKKIQTIYFNRNEISGNIDVLQNPSLSFVRNGLMSTFYRGKANDQVLLLTEDSMARTFFRRMVANSQLPYANEFYEMNALDIHVPWDSLISLTVNDSDLYNKSIIILDGDLNLESNQRPLQEALSSAHFNINSPENKSHLFLLPTCHAIETEMVLFAQNSSQSESFYNSPFVYQKQLTPSKLQEYIYDAYKEGPQKTEDYKKIFKGALLPYQQALMDSWIQQHISDVDTLLAQVYESFKKIQSELWPY